MCREASEASEASEAISLEAPDLKRIRSGSILYGATRIINSLFLVLISLIIYKNDLIIVNVDSYIIFDSGPYGEN